LNLISIDQAQVNGDHDRIKQVFLNLISNAISYTPKNGKVDISLEKVDGQAKVTISDSGPGISEADLPHIFERFYRGDKSRTHTATSGFGLGLSIAKMITEKLGGKIEVESKVGVGTKFIVYFPLLEE
jgi:signal transduction histidine kinase